MPPSPLIEKRIDSQPSWIIRSANVELAVTKLGAQMAPVTFCRDERSAHPVRPYYVSPWQNEKPAGLAAAEIPLRGDFFCLPFGGNGDAWRGEKHPLHGETAGGEWSLDDCWRDGNATTLRLRLETKVRPGIVRRSFTLIDGQNVVYCNTVVEGFSGKATFAHHAILDTAGPEQALLVSTSKFLLGRTSPRLTSNPAKGEYQSLAQNAPFRSLSRVPSVFQDQPPCDCSGFPVRPGFCDLLQQFERPAVHAKPVPSWVAAVNIAQGWMWFAFKDPSIMPGRIFWIENHGRHFAPWSGRNSCLGIEDGCTYFGEGIAASSRPNTINRHGIPTSFVFPAKRRVEIRYIQGAARIPRGFDRIAKARFISGGAVFESESGARLTVPVNHSFLFDAR